MSRSNPHCAIAVLIPCHNEAVTIASTIQGFQQALPNAKIYVYDNRSTDNTSGVAKQAGAIVRYEPRQGKGNVVRRMFADIEADVYILVDGDNTYQASKAPAMIDKLMTEQYDMVVGKRITHDSHSKTAFRFGHRFGNRLFTKLIATFFGYHFEDVLSGYRVFSRRFVKSFPAKSHGFEIETELTIHSLELRLPTTEVDTDYITRPEGSESKLNSFRDGLRILVRLGMFLKEVRPLLFFSCIGLMLAILSIGLATPLFYGYIKTGLVLRIPTAILATGMMILAFLSIACGMILDNVCSTRQALKRFFYLSHAKHTD